MKKLLTAFCLLAGSSLLTLYAPPSKPQSLTDIYNQQEYNEKREKVCRNNFRHQVNLSIATDFLDYSDFRVEGDNIYRLYETVGSDACTWKWEPVGAMGQQLVFRIYGAIYTHQYQKKGDEVCLYWKVEHRISDEYVSRSGVKRTCNRMRSSAPW